MEGRQDNKPDAGELPTVSRSLEQDVTVRGMEFDLGLIEELCERSSMNARDKSIEELQETGGKAIGTDCERR